MAVMVKLPPLHVELKPPEKLKSEPSLIEDERSERKTSELPAKKLFTVRRELGV
jgi:hypothetical protein